LSFFLDIYTSFCIKSDHSMKNLLSAIVFSFIAASAVAQGPYASFVDFQRTLPRPSDAMKRKEDTLQKQFEAKGLSWPAKYV